MIKQAILQPVMNQTATEVTNHAMCDIVLPEPKKSVDGFYYIKNRNLIRHSNVPGFDLSMNYIWGCNHSCAYCWVQENRNCRQPVRVARNVLELLDFEMPRIKRELEYRRYGYYLPGNSPMDVVHCSFNSDPWMFGYDQIKQLGLQIVQKVNSYGVGMSTLTKGLPLLELAYLPGKEFNWTGITVAGLSDQFHNRFEKNTAKPMERIRRLKQLKSLGCKVYAFVEPFMPPELSGGENILEILEQLKFVDILYFGKLNHFEVQLANACPNYAKFYIDTANIVKEFGAAHNIRVIIKHEILALYARQ